MLPQSLIDRLPPQDSVFSLDFETPSLEDYTLEVASWSYRPTEGALVSDAVDLRGFTPEQKLEFLTELLRRAKTVAFHNFKFDAKVIDNAGYDVIQLFDKVCDTVIMAYLHTIDRNEASLATLAPLVNREKMDYAGSRDAGTEEFLRYAAMDAEITFLLYEFFRDYFRKYGLLVAHYLESETIFLTYIMERNGIQIDLNRARELQASVDKQVDEIHKALSMAVGTPINFNSSKQLANLFYTTLGMTPMKEFYTGKGAPSTKAAAIEALIALDSTPENTAEFMKQLLEYKKLSKLRSSFLSDKFFSMISPRGRIHPTFNSMGTETGRYSSSRPNQQNIPRNSEDGRAGSAIRSLYVASPGKTLISVDFSQIELRLLAHFTRDPVMVQAFRNGEDLHQVTADLIGITRSHAKNINFGLAYGLGAQGLARNARIPIARAAMYLRNYYDQFRTIKPWKEQIVSYAYKNGGIRTISGRYRNLKKFIRFEDGSFERRAINTLIQGSAADLLKYCTARIFRRFLNKDLKILMTVHDELLFECDDGREGEFMPVIQDYMENTFKLIVPIEAVPAASKTWLEAKG
jgi:DNA polymerase-1